jgi:hypothetical protein
MSEKRKMLMTVILVGSLWGGLEALVSAASHDIDFVMPRSVILGFIAVLVLTSGRLLLPKVGTTLAAGLVAAGFKLLSLPDVLTCQIAAVVGQAAILELVFSLAEAKSMIRKPLVLSTVMIGASYLNSTVFAFSQAYLFHNHYWLDRGTEGLLRLTFTTGSVTAAVCALAAILAYALANRNAAGWDSLVNRHSAVFVRSAIAVSLGSWFVGLLVTGY